MINIYQHLPFTFSFSLIPALHACAESLLALYLETQPVSVNHICVVTGFGHKYK